MCTGITLATKNRDVFVRARTMEFGVSPHSKIIFIPRGHQRQGTTGLLKHTGKQWTSKYASVGASAFGLPIIVDGVNEKGLSIGLFYFSGKDGAEYMDAEGDGQQPNTMAPWQLGSFILETCASLDEVKTEVAKIVVPHIELVPGFAPPVHFIVTNDKGESIVIEYFDKKLHFFDAPLGVLTNTPSYDWHTKNLANYISLSLRSVNPSPFKNIATGEDYDPGTFGQGTGLFGIPGDITPPSRFVRAVAATQALYVGDHMEKYVPHTGKEAVLHAFHILNSFDIPTGSARSAEKHLLKKPVKLSESDYTVWTSAVDLTERKYYFRTYEDSRIRVIDLKDYKDKPEMFEAEMTGDEQFVELPLQEVTEAKYQYQ